MALKEKALFFAFCPILRFLFFGRRKAESCLCPRSDFMSIPVLDFEALCQKKGLKMTDQRRVVAQVLLQAEGHPDVEEVYAMASQLDGKVSLATVYRTVRILEDAGVIQKHSFGDGRARYEAVSDDHHDHLIDIDTREVIEFYDPKLEALKQEIAARYGYTLIDHRLDLYGRRKKHTEPGA